MKGVAKKAGYDRDCKSRAQFLVVEYVSSERPTGKHAAMIHAQVRNVSPAPLACGYFSRLFWRVREKLKNATSLRYQSYLRSDLSKKLYLSLNPIRVLIRYLYLRFAFWFTAHK